MLLPHPRRVLRPPAYAETGDEPLPTVRQPFSEGIEPMTDDEQILEAIAQAFGTLSERLSKELEDAFNQMAQLMGGRRSSNTKSWPSSVSKRQQ
jgi:hypothetical protein